jgi:hypothetical protein
MKPLCLDRSSIAHLCQLCLASLVHIRLRSSLGLHFCFRDLKSDVVLVKASCVCLDLLELSLTLLSVLYVSVDAGSLVKPCGFFVNTGGLALEDRGMAAVVDIF